MGGGSSLAARRSQPSSLAVSRLTVNAVKDLDGGASLGFLGQELRPVWDKVAGGVNVKIAFRRGRLEAKRQAIVIFPFPPGLASCDPLGTPRGPLDVRATIHAAPDRSERGVFASTTARRRAPWMDRRGRYRGEGTTRRQDSRAGSRRGLAARQAHRMGPPRCCGRAPWPVGGLRAP
jgi:hypothetical protein